MSTVNETETWLSKRAAGKRMGRSGWWVQQLINKGLSRSRCYPGGKPEVSSTDLDKLIAGSITESNRETATTT